MRLHSTSRRLVAAVGGVLLALTGLAFVVPSADAAFTQFSYTGPRVPIPDGNTTGVNVPLTITGLATVTDAVAFRIDGGTCTAAQGATTVGLDHSWVGDLTLTLTSPAGTSVVLMNRPGGINNSGNNFCKTTLADAATNSIQDITIAGAPWQGSFKPANPLSAFAGENPNGTWVLHVTDSVTIDTGSVRAFSIGVDASAPVAPTITGPATATAVVGSAFSYTPTVTGHPAPTVSVTPNANFPDQLPSGLSLDASTGAITGTPAAGTGGVYKVRLVASNSVGNDARNLTLSVGEAPTLTGDATATATVGSGFSYTPTTLTGFPAPTVAVVPNANFPDQLPSGLSLNASTGAITGTPADGTGGVYKVRLRASNAAGNNALTVTLTVDESPGLGGAATATGRVGDPFSYTPTELSGYPPSSVDLVVGTLPAGLSLSSTTGAITGTPAAGTGGVYYVTLRASNGIGDAATLDVVITINQPPAITGPATANGKVGVAFSYTPTSLTGYPAPIVGVSPALPGGLSLNALTGAITGTPTQYGTFPVTLTAANGVDPPAGLDVTLIIDKPDVTGLAPTITGLAQARQTLTAHAGPVVPADSTLAYVWNADGVPISNQTGSTLVLTNAQAGKHITVTITASHTGYNPQTKTSDPTDYVRQYVANPKVSLDDNTPGRGQTVTVLAQGLQPGSTYTFIDQYLPNGSVDQVADQYGEVHLPLHFPANATLGYDVIGIYGYDPPTATSLTYKVHG